MQTVWYQHLRNKEEQEKFKQIVQSSKITLDRLNEIVYTMIKSGESTSEEDYESPSWAYRQADRNGYIRALQTITKLIDIKEP